MYYFEYVQFVPIYFTPIHISTSVFDNLMQESEDETSGKPRPFHLTRSVYIRHLPPRIAAEDIVEVSKV